MYRAHAAPAYLDNAITPVSFFRSFPVHPARRWPVAVGDPARRIEIDTGGGVRAADGPGAEPIRRALLDVGGGHLAVVGVARRLRGIERERDVPCRMAMAGVWVFFFARVALHGEFRAVMVVGWTV
jgi:hypothetical protein